MKSTKKTVTAARVARQFLAIVVYAVLAILTCYFWYLLFTNQQGAISAKLDLLVVFLTIIYPLIGFYFLDKKHKKNKRISHRSIILSLFGGTLLLAVAMGLFLSFMVTLSFIFSSQDGHMPSGKELISNYSMHKSEFKSLVEKIESDQKKGLERIDKDWTRPEDVASIGMTQEEVENYRKELNNIHVPRGFYAFDDHMEFMAGATGISVSGSSTGYLYTKQKVENYFKQDCGYSIEPLADIDTFKNCSNNSYSIYQKIDDDWYVYYEYED